MATEIEQRPEQLSWVAGVFRNPWRLAGPLFVVVVVGLAISRPLVGIAVVASCLLAGLYLGGRSQIAAVVAYVILLFVVSPRLAFGIYEVTPALVIGLLCLVLWAGGRASYSGGNRPRPPMTLVILGYASVVVFTYGFGLSRPLSVDQIAGADRTIVKFLALIGVVLLILDTVRSERQLDYVLGLIVAGGVFVAMAAVLQTFFDFQIVDQMKLPGFTDRGIKDTGLKLRLGLERATGTARHPIEMGTTSAIILPLALHFSTYGRAASVRAMSLAGALVLIVAMLLSLSRSAYIGLVVALIVLIPRWTSKRRFRFLIALIPTIVVLLLLAPAAFDAAIDLISSWQGEDIEGARISARTEDYGVIREIVLTRPWFGQGIGTFVGPEAFAADNQYLSTLIETGFVGTAALIVVMLTGYGSAQTVYRSSTTDRDRDRAVSITAGIVVGMVSFALFDAMAFDLAVGSMFLMLAVAGALYSITVVNVGGRRERSVVTPARYSGGEHD